MEKVSSSSSSARGRESGRLKEQDATKVLDNFTRRKRQMRQLHALEQDNFQDDPKLKMEDLPSNMPKALKEDMKRKAKKKGSVSARLRKERMRVTFAQLLEEAKLHELPRDTPSYLTANAPPSRIPPKPYCAVCGFPAPHTCVVCGVRYCQLRCLKTHKETRCLKWTS